MKRGELTAFLALFFIIASMPLILAQNKIGISQLKESYAPRENISVKIELYDSNNNPLNDEVMVILTDQTKKTSIEKTVLSNSIEELNLGESAIAGVWTISAEYSDKSTGEILNAKAFFFVEANELAKFELNEDNLTITNIGNSRYAKTVSIIIGDSIGSKDLDLAVGEKASFRLLAPDGDYSLRITDGTTTLSTEKVHLTGDAIGIIDERAAGAGSVITGGIGQKSVFKNTFVYVFILAVFGAAVLLTIERKVRNRLGK